MKYHTEATLPQDAYDAQYTEAAIVQAIKDAYQELRANQKKHRELRTLYLESLAEAIVLHQSPNLEASEAAPMRIERTKHHVKQLIHREKRKRMYKKIGTTLHPHSSTGLSRVDIPDSRAQGPNLGSPDDPKTWKGPWISVTHPEEIAKIVASMNVCQYNQAQETPFGSGALADLIGRNGDKPAAKALLEGSLPDHIFPSLLPETIRILRTLAMPIKQLHHHHDNLITEDEFISTFKISSEATSSSPSGRHIGHYKAIIKDPVLVSLRTNMMNIPFQLGIAPERWTKVTNIMLEKEAGNPRSHRLRILALFECDFNQAKRIIIARKTSHHIEDNKLVPGMQFGSRPGRNCQSAVLQKVISHDIVRLTRQTAAFMENDAIGCYDRLINNILLLVLIRVGLSPSVSTSMGKIWDQTTHHIKTIYGTSTTTYSHTPQVPLFGPGQGSTCGPIFWLLCFCLIVDLFDPELSTAMFISACMGMVVRTMDTAFVDDSSLSVTSQYVRLPNLSTNQNDINDNNSAIESLSIIVQHWERLLFTTGGAINMQKSFWYLMARVWKNGQPIPAPISKAPGNMDLTSGYNTFPTTVPHIEVTEAFRTLGVYISPSGSQQKQIKILRQHSEEYSINVSMSSLTPDDAYSSYMQFLRPKLTYPLPCCSLTQKQCQHIQAPALAALLPKMHLNQHTPHVIVFGENKYGGLEPPDLYTDQGYGQLKLLIGHLKMKDEIGNLILIAISHLQIHVGSAKPFFTLPYPIYAKWIDSNWLTAIWKHTHQLQIVVDVEKHWTLEMARTNDKFISTGDTVV
jgi:hypothetical protein